MGGVPECAAAPGPSNTIPGAFFERQRARHRVRVFVFRKRVCVRDRERERVKEREKERGHCWPFQHYPRCVLGAVSEKVYLGEKTGT